jgi:hypothetical protein
MDPRFRGDDEGEAGMTVSIGRFQYNVIPRLVRGIHFQPPMNANFFKPQRALRYTEFLLRNNFV